MEEETYLLKQLIFFRQNDMMLDIELGQSTEEDKNNLTNLIIGVTRYVNNIRYCTSSSCGCSPESSIERNYELTKHIVQNTITALSPIPWKTIEKIIRVKE